MNTIANIIIKLLESMSENYQNNIYSEIEEGTINPNNTIHEIVSLYKSELNNKKISVRIKLEENTNFNLLENNLEYIMRSIILNAFTHTNENGYVEINTKVIKDSFYFTVTDNGNGISRKEIQRIFESDDLKNSSLRKCQEIIKNLDGDLIIGSELGMGTKVTISLPI